MTRNYSVSEIEVAREVAMTLIAWLKEAAGHLPADVQEEANKTLRDCGAIMRDGIAEIRAEHDKGRGKA